MIKVLTPVCHSFRSNVKPVKLSGQIFRLMYFSENKFTFRWACQILGRDGWKICAKRDKCLIFQGFQREYDQEVPKWLGGSQLDISGLKISLSYNFFMEKVENNAF